LDARTSLRPWIAVQSRRTLILCVDGESLVFRYTWRMLAYKLPTIMQCRDTEESPNITVNAWLVMNNSDNDHQQFVLFIRHSN
jgi:hypothetical protein